MDYFPIIQIGDCLVSSEILTECFCCDFSKCKGACCIIGDSGAPLEEAEADVLERNYGKFSAAMTAAGRAAIDKKGFFEIDVDGDMVTPLVNGEECAYCCFDSSRNCLCAIEKCWEKGQGDFRKPVSCSLYPIRISTLSNGMRAFNLHRWDICKDAFVKGKKDNVKVYQFLKGSIVEAFGQDFWDALDQAAKHVSGQGH